MKEIVQRFKRQGKKGCISSKGLFIQYNTSDLQQIYIFLNASSSDLGLSQEHNKMTMFTQIFNTAADFSVKEMGPMNASLRTLLIGQFTVSIVTIESNSN